jgi:nitrate reductase (cytochrome), electron transfer subunit
MRMFALVLIALVSALLAVQAQEPGLLEDDEGGPVVHADQHLDPFRRQTPLTVEPTPPPMARTENVDRRRERGWPEQPPTIPHAIDGYQLNKNSNRCMVCHARASAEQFQAPMVSVTHFMDRDGQVLSQLSARRYFCTACHVVQTDARPLVENEFIDVDTLLRRQGGR